MATPMLAGLLKVAASDPKLKGLATQVGEPHLHITGIDQARPWAIGTLANQAPVLVVTATGREAEDLTAELTAMMGDKVAQFPAWETLPHERLSPGADIVGRRAQVLHRIAEGKLRVVVTAARGYSQPILKNVEGRSPISLAEDMEIELEAIVSQLEFRAYKHVDMVAKRGEYAVRGGILMSFPRRSITRCVWSSGAMKLPISGSFPSPTSARFQRLRSARWTSSRRVSFRLLTTSPSVPKTLPCSTRAMLPSWSF